MIYKNVAASVPFVAINPATGAGMSGLTGITARIQQDTLPATDLTSPAITDVGGGAYRIALSAANLNANTIVLTPSHPSANITPVTVVTDDPYPVAPTGYATNAELAKVVNKLPADNQTIAGVNDVQPQVNVTTQTVDLTDVLKVLATLLTAFTKDTEASDEELTVLQPVATAAALSTLATAFTADPDTGTLTLTLTPEQLTAIGAAVLATPVSDTTPGARRTLDALVRGSLSWTADGTTGIKTLKADGTTVVQTYTVRRDANGLIIEVK